MINRERMKYRKRIVCPCCGEGFIKHKNIEPVYARGSFERSTIFRAPTMDYPICSNCETKFKVKISNELEIDLEVVGR